MTERLSTKGRPLPPVPMSEASMPPPVITATINHPEAEEAKQELKMFWLLLYNFVMGCGWLVVFGRVSWSFATSESPDSMFSDIGHFPVTYLLLASWLEVVHSMVGLVRSGPAQAFLQTAGRSIVYFGVVTRHPGSQGSMWMSLLLLVWAASEIIRYPFYLMSTINACPNWLNTARYSAFVVLYPLGFLSEFAMFVIGWESLQWSMSLPNKWNLAFSLPLTMVVYLLLAYGMGAPFLYLHMLAQRRKRLQTKARESCKTK